MRSSQCACSRAQRRRWRSWLAFLRRTGRPLPSGVPSPLINGGCCSRFSSIVCLQRPAPGPTSSVSHRWPLGCMSVPVDQRQRYQRRSGHLAPEKVTSSFSSAVLSLFSTRGKRRSTSNGCASKSHLGLCYKAILLADNAAAGRPSAWHRGSSALRSAAVAGTVWRRPLSLRIELGRPADFSAVLMRSEMRIGVVRAAGMRESFRHDHFQRYDPRNREGPTAPR